MKRLFYICNALDDTTRLERGIVTDSPAASRKILLISQALRKVNVRPIVVSMGRGKQDRSGRYFKSKVRRINGIPVVYLPFYHAPVLSELLSLFSIVSILWRVRSKKGSKAALFYNRMPVYFLGLCMARAFRFRTILDLEDGDINNGDWSLGMAKSKISTWVFDVFISGGALLACSALESKTKLLPTTCCYGTSEIHYSTPNLSMFPMTVLFGGTVSFDTGAQLLIDVVNILRKDAPSWVNNIQFEISGKGDCISQFETLAEDVQKPKVIVHGRATDNEYRELLGRTKVGLALKPNSGVLAHTTFPSKVIEFASHGVLVVTTDISDVKKVLADGAIYLMNDHPQHLIDKLRWILENRKEANDLALKGKRNVAETCSPKIVGKKLEQFLFDTED